MANSSSSSSSSSFGNSTMTTTQAAISEEELGRVKGFFQDVFVDKPLPNSDATQSHDFYSDLIRSLLQIRHLRRGHVSCLLSVKPTVTNFYDSLHGGAVAAVAETLSYACARTVVAEDKELFLGELAMSYLSAAPQHSELIVDASVVRSGRNLTVIALEFKLKEPVKLVYMARATFYNMPVAKL